jgi:16S rRNA (cytosine967-C5)-methyltransferase
MSAPKAEKGGRLDPTNGRDLAVLALRRQSEHGYVRDTLSDIAAAANAPPEHISFALELAMGVMRHRLTLTRLIRELLTGSWQSLPPDIRHILLIGSYQLLYLDSIPDYAAISEAVTQARRSGFNALSKVVNGVLRNVQRHIVERTEWSAKLPVRRAIRADYAKAVVLNIDLLADRMEDLVGYLSIATSLPTEIVTRWIRTYGKDQAEQMCWASQWRPPAVLRPNRLKTDGEKLLASLRAENIEGELDKPSDSVFIPSAGGITHWKAFREGLCQVQDVTAQQAVVAAELRPGQIVLDLAAGAGTKSTQAAEIMKNDGLVIAHDVATARLDRIASNAARLGIEIIEVVPPDRLDATLADYDLDVILVDVPCSNTGVFARRPEAKYRQTPQSLASLKKQQIAILRRAISLAADSGAARIVYSTCSIEPEEDEQVIQEVLTGQSEWIVADAHLFAPTFTGPITSWRDGGYVAVIDSAVKGA